MDKFKLPPLPEPLDAVLVEWRNQTEMLTPRDDYYLKEQMRQYAEQAVAPLLAEIERLKNSLEEANKYRARCVCGYPMPCNKTVPINMCKSGHY